MKKKTAIVTGGTANDVPAMACLVMNIKDTNPNLADEIVIFHNGIAQKDQTLINDIFPTRFILYESPFADVEAFGDVVTNYFSLMVFCKYECFRLLDEYECVIWTDYDVVIVGDLSELKKNNLLGISMIHLGTIRDNFIEAELPETLHTRFDLKQAGVCLVCFVLFDSCAKFRDIYAACIKYTRELAHYIYLPEQAILGIVLQEYGATIYNLPKNLYHVHPKNNELASDVKILHAYGQPKFWNGIYNATWEKNYKRWIKMGGTPYEHRTLKGKLRKTILYREIRKIGRLFK